VIVFFDKDGKVARWEGGNLPTEKEYIARIAGPAPNAKKAAETEAVLSKPAPPRRAGRHRQSGRQQPGGRDDQQRQEITRI
jgi:hypothetical protein